MGASMSRAAWIVGTRPASLDSPRESLRRRVAAASPARKSRGRYRSQRHPQVRVSRPRREKLVIADHIIPWSEDVRNRLDPHNGPCLSALHDRAFDQGLITIMPDFRVRVSPKIKAYDRSSRHPRRRAVGGLRPGRACGPHLTGQRLAAARWERKCAMSGVFPSSIWTSLCCHGVGSR
ncbi:MAG: HNH endonuclease [Nannocystis sp.]|nr:HNH endonuclease [Nannocystis sp.]